MEEESEPLTWKDLQNRMSKLTLVELDEPVLITLTGQTYDETYRANYTTNTRGKLSIAINFIGEEHDEDGEEE